MKKELKPVKKEAAKKQPAKKAAGKAKKAAPAPAPANDANTAEAPNQEAKPEERIVTPENIDPDKATELLKRLVAEVNEVKFEDVFTTILALVNLTSVVITALNQTFSPIDNSLERFFLDNLAARSSEDMHMAEYILPNLVKQQENK